MSINASFKAKKGVSENPPRALVVCILLQIFKQLTGISAIYAYSSQLFGSKTDETYIYKGNFSAMLIAAVNFVTAVISMPFVERLGRRLMLLVGFFIMAGSDILVGVFQQTRSPLEA